MRTIRRIEEKDYKDIHHLNTQLGYDFDLIRVRERIGNLLETGMDIISVLEIDGKVVGYIHGIPYNTLYADDLMNMVTIVYAQEEDIKEEDKAALLHEFEKRVQKNGYYGVRLSADVERDTLHEFLLTNGFANKRDLKHYIKYFE